MRQIVMLLLVAVVCSGPLLAQPSNEMVLIQMLESSLDTLPPCRTIEASYDLPGLDDLPKTVSSTSTMRLATPTITYEKLGKNQFSRSVILPVVIQGDSTAQRQTLQYTDEITWRQMRTFIRVSDKPFRGEDPSIVGKFLIPGAAILLGTGITAGLFYLRSR